MKNDFNYKWSRLFASKRYHTKDGVIKLTPEEQQELLDDAERLDELNKNNGFKIFHNQCSAEKPKPCKTPRR